MRGHVTAEVERGNGAYVKSGAGRTERTERAMSGKKMQGIKRAAVAAVMMVAVVGSGWGFGIWEKPSDEAYSEVWFGPAGTDGVESKLFHLKVNYENGLAAVEVMASDKATLSYAVLKVNSSFYRPAGLSGSPAQVPASAASAAALSALFGSLGSSGGAAALVDEQESGLVTASVSKGSSVNWGSVNAPEFALASSTVTMKLGFESVAERTCELLLVKQTGGYELVKFTYTPEFFCGEKALFDAVSSSYSYQQKALALMNRVFPGFKNMAGDLIDSSLGAGAAFWGMYESMQTITTGEKPVSISELQRRLKTALGKHVRYTSERQEYREGAKSALLSYPFLSFGPESFDALYGARRNLYLSTYFHYLLWKNKPLLSNLFREQAQSTILSGYDYSQYQVLSEEEGEAVAEAALRYLSWGVEYTPDSGSANYDRGASSSRIASGEKDFLSSWVNATNASTQKREANYLPPHDGAAAAVTYPISYPEAEMKAVTGRTHREVGAFLTDKITILGRLRTGERATVSRADTYTSENFAWSSSGVTPRAWQEKRTTQETGTVFTDFSTDGHVDRLNDGKTALHSEILNTVVPASDAGMAKAVGYEFSAGKRVGGLVLVNGYGEGTVKYGSMPNAGLLDIEWKTAAGKWTPLDLSSAGGTYREFCFDYRSGDGFMDFSGKPGGSLANGYYYSDHGKRLSWVYFSFPNGIPDCRGVRIVDRTANPRLEVAELLVFAEDPVSYLSEAKPKVSGYSHIPLTSILAPESSSFYGAGAWSGLPESDAELFKGLSGALSPYLLWINGSPEAGVESAAGRDEVSLRLGFRKSSPFRQVVLWEKDNAGSVRSAFAYAPVSTLSAYGLESSPLFSTYNDTRSSVFATLSTPFASGPGNPLPYVRMGIDSPRTFAYRMLEQQRVRQWYKTKVPAAADDFPSDGSTVAEDAWGCANYNGGYVDELELLKAAGAAGLAVNASGYYTAPNAYTSKAKPENADKVVLKPFLPGTPGKVKALKSGYIDAYASPYQTDKLAGVDSLGLLAGALSMCSLDVYSAVNKNVPDQLDLYFAMNGSGAGRDSEGKPVFYGKDEASSFAGNFRFTRSDIERATVIVPDLSMIRKGDILVNYNAAGEPHVGIVVGFSGGKPAHGADPDSFLSDVLVVSVRSGFRMVSLGRWGNPSGLFGGFTTTPKEYQLRRLLKLKPGGDVSKVKSTPEPWEVMVEPTEKLRREYPDNETDAPRAYLSSKNLADFTQEEPRYKFYKELPPTSLSTKATMPIFGPDEKEKVICFTGWRDVSLTNTKYSYHRGIDIRAASWNAVNILPIVAPEDGKFWIFQSVTYNGADKEASIILKKGSNTDSPKEEWLKICTVSGGNLWPCWCFYD